MSPLRHLVSCASLAFGLVNLTFWCTALLVLMLARTIAPPPAQPRIRKRMEAIYRTAVRGNDWWFRRILGYRWQPSVTLDPTRTYLVIANHQSWVDSLLTQTAVVHQGPILKVLVKEQLARWPLLGLIFRVFDFPLLKRRAADPADEPQRRQQDRDRIRQACTVLARSPGAMLIYPEGTRFTPEKQRELADHGVDFQHLLPPRPGGFATIIDAVRLHADSVIDIDIYYPDTTHFWQFLSGAVREPVVRISKIPLAEIADPAGWLVRRWQEKDRWLTEQALGRSSDSRPIR